MKLIRSKFSDLKKSNPEKILNFSFAIIIAITITIGFFNWSSHADFQKNTTLSYELENLKDKIVHLDEKLMTSARMAILNEDLRWEDLYKKYEPQLDRAINEVKRIAPNVFLFESAALIDSANINLVAMEHEAFNLLRKGEKEAAKALLFSVRYENEKKVYNEGLEHVTIALNDRTQLSVEQHREGTNWHLILNFISIVILLFVWWSSSSMMRRHFAERKKMEEASKENEQTYRSIFENSADGMFLMTDVFKECNQSVCTLFNCNLEDIVGQSPTKFSPEVQPDGRNSILSAKEKIDAAFKGIPQRFYWQHKTKDNILFDAEVALNAVIVRGKNFIHAIVRDISETKKLEKIQKALFDISEATYTATDMVSLYKIIHEIVGTLMLAKNFYIAIYNEQTEMISFPYMVDEFDPPFPPKKLGRGLTEYILRIGEAKLVDAKLDLELMETGEIKLVGTPTLIWLGVPLKVREKIIGVIVVQDYQNASTYGEEEKQLLVFVAEHIAQVIERKRNSDAIKVYAEQLKELNQTKDKFFSIIAHDLKSPFLGLLGLTDLIASGDEELSKAELVEYSKSIHDSASTLYRLIENLLKWAQMQRGSINYIPKEIELQKIAALCIETIKYNAIEKGIAIINDIPQSQKVFADDKMIYTVIRNLLTNAIKFTRREGRVVLRTKKMDNGQVEVSISDTGVGISAKEIKNLFKLEEKVSSKGTEGESGTGLGLLLCKEFVEKNGGKIWVESQEEKGSTFSFSLKEVI
ncbi:MAG: ATP-binding protein [Ignavibacteriaceae bacterium]|nr:ATP-binding protein [Ignavibacteriaceae bacterium]